jgi:endonuclease/exonuclease/phosphatase family metal-dependent hydrolase
MPCIHASDKRLPRLLVAVVAMVALTEITIGGEPVRVMTFNVRYATAPDGDNAWAQRKDLALDVIRTFNPDIFGVQEALRVQMDDLAAALPGYASVGVGRDADGGGEYSAMFYRRTRFDVAASGTFWLSDTPDEPGSHTWGNDLPRICTWARLLDRVDSRRFTVINTHWDHQSQPARLASGKLMADRIAGWARAGEPVIATGDFNAAPGNPALAAVVGDGPLLVDTFGRDRLADENIGTAHAFTGATGGGKIDHIFVTDHWRVENAAIVHTHDGPRYPSDHFPVTAVVSLPAVASSPTP